LPVVLNEHGPDGTIDYLYARSMISETSPEMQYYYQYDGLGSSTTLTDATGALKASYSYDPWGQLLASSDPLGTKNKYKFTGQQLDPATGLYFNRARYYDPPHARFQSPDLLAGRAAFPVSVR
jgi:RHS repeat-associated protein